jgi:hypothetical protein
MRNGKANKIIFYKPYAVVYPYNLKAHVYARLLSDEKESEK